MRINCEEDSLVEIQCLVSSVKVAVSGMPYRIQAKIQSCVKYKVTSKNKFLIESHPVLANKTKQMQLNFCCRKIESTLNKKTHRCVV